MAQKKRKSPFSWEPNWWKVSIWAGRERFPQNIDVLKNLFGVDYYDSGRQEVLMDYEGGSLQPIEELIKRAGYSETFLRPAVSAAVGRGITEALYIIVQFGIAYDPVKTRRKAPQDPVFLGVFDWNNDADPP